MRRIGGRGCGIIAIGDLEIKFILKVQRCSHIKERYRSGVWLVCKKSTPQNFPRQYQVLAA